MEKTGDLRYIAHHGDCRQRDWDVGAIARALAANNVSAVWPVEPDPWIAEYLNFALDDHADLIDLYGVRDRRGGIVAHQSLAQDPAYLLIDRRAWRNEADFTGSVVAETFDFALVRPTLVAGQAPPIVDVADQRVTSSAGVEHPSPLVWLGSATDWKVVMVQPGDVELSWTAGGRVSAGSTPIQLSVSPSGDQRSSLLGPGQPRLVFPVERGLNEVQVQLADRSAAEGRPIAVGLRSLPRGNGSAAADLLVGPRSDK
ncbi:MAG: hypothetical protein JO023_17935 [Chloroflexi bacterium]|nr:hypothetical protein [Chloroflexota bacterium]